MTDETLLLRQVHPTFVQQGRVTSQAFRPTPKDENRLSTYDGDLIQPDLAWQHYTGTLGYDSIGVMAVSYAECTGFGLPVEPDPEPFPEHAYIDFSGFQKNEVEKLSKKLKSKAEARDWLFRHPPNSL